MIMPIEMCVLFYGKGQVHRAIFYVSLALANYTNTNLCSLDFFTACGHFTDITISTQGCSNKCAINCKLPLNTCYIQTFC